ncbi:hypothetical protein MRY87_06140 [bacterium]|nr:hypothetical protein [bacterium]
MELSLPDYADRQAQTELFVDLSDLFDRLKIPFSPENVRPALSDEGGDQEYTAFHISLSGDGVGEIRSPSFLFLLPSAVESRSLMPKEVREFLQFFARPECSTITVQKIIPHYQIGEEELLDIRVNDKSRACHFLLAYDASSSSEAHSSLKQSLELRYKEESETRLRFISTSFFLPIQQIFRGLAVSVPSSFVFAEVGEESQFCSILRMEEEGRMYMEVRAMSEQSIEGETGEEKPQAEQGEGSLPAEIRIEGISMNFLHYLALEEGDELELPAAGSLPASLLIGGVVVAAGEISPTEEGLSFGVGEKTEKNFVL